MSASANELAEDGRQVIGPADQRRLFDDEQHWPVVEREFADGLEFMLHIVGHDRAGKGVQPTTGHLVEIVVQIIVDAIEVIG